MCVRAHIHTHTHTLSHTQCHPRAVKVCHCLSQKAGAEAAPARASAWPGKMTRRPGPKHPCPDALEAKRLVSTLRSQSSLGSRTLPAGRTVSGRSAGPRATGTLQPGSQRCLFSAAAARIPGASITSPPPPPPRAPLARPPLPAASCKPRGAGCARWTAAEAAVAPARARSAAPAEQPRRQPEHRSRAALPRRRLWPRRLTTPGSQSPPRPARRGETNQSGRPKVCLRLCSAGLFPGEDAAGVWDGGRQGWCAGWGAQGPKTKIQGRSPAHKSGPGALSDCHRRASWHDRTLPVTVPRALARRFSVLASLCSGLGTQVEAALLETESLEVVTALKEASKVTRQRPPPNQEAPLVVISLDKPNLEKGHTEKRFQSSWQSGPSFSALHINFNPVKQPPKENNRNHTEAASPV